jgi:hypothetical protein
VEHSIARRPITRKGHIYYMVPHTHILGGAASLGDHSSISNHHLTTCPFHAATATTSPRQARSFFRGGQNCATSAFSLLLLSHHTTYAQLREERSARKVRFRLPERETANRLTVPRRPAIQNGLNRATSTKGTVWASETHQQLDNHRVEFF